MPIVSANRLEIVRGAEMLAREKGIEPDIVIDAIAEAIERAARLRYGAENRIQAEIDKKTGEVKLLRLREVVEEIDNIEEQGLQITLENAKQLHDGAQVGDMIAEDLPPIEFGRIAAQAAKQVITQKVRAAEREKQYEEYKDKIGEIINGAVKRMEYGHVIVDLGQSEAVVRHEELLPREQFRGGDRIRAYIYDIRRENKGPQIFLSRRHGEFMAKLFAQEVPEIYDGVIKIISVARDPGSRAKISVASSDSSIDPVGACVGMRGSRVQAVVNELQGEKIDIIRYSEDPAEFIVKALAPAEVVKVVLDEENARVEAVVPDDQLSLAIGRRGQNVRLASQLTGWTIDILTEAEESQRRQKEFTENSTLFMEALNVDEVIAQLLASEGFSSVEEVAFIDEEELKQIEGFDEETAQALQERAREYLEERALALENERKELGVADELAALEGITPAQLVALGKKDIKTLEDFADLASDELTGWSERKQGETTKHEGMFDDIGGIDNQSAQELILRARVQLGWIEESSEEEESPEEVEGEVEGEAEGESGEESEETPQEQEIALEEQNEEA